jgi:hypothetical protein
MGLRRYTVCTYFPDFARGGQSFDYGVACASAEELAVVGVPLATLGLAARGKVGKLVVERTFSLLEQTVERVLRDVGRESFLNVLAGLLANNWSGLQYRPVVETQSEEDVLDLALRLFGDKVGALLPASPSDLHRIVRCGEFAHVG